MKRLLLFPIALLFAAILLLIYSNAQTSYSNGNLPKLSIGVVPDAEFGLLAVAQEKGFFRNQELDVTLKPFVLGREALAPLNEEEVQLSSSYITPFTNQVLSGKDLVILGTLSNLTNNFVLVANREKDINGINDIKGKKVGIIKNTSSEYFFQQLMSLHGIALDQIEIRELSTQNLVSSLTSGEVSAAVLWNPYLHQAQQELGLKAIEFKSDFYQDATLLIADRSYVEANPEIIHSILIALREAEQYLKVNEAEAITIVSAFTSYQNRDLVEGMIQDKVIDMGVSLDNRLMYILSQNTRFFVANGLYPDKTINYKNYIAIEQLKKVSPEAVTIF